MRTENWCGHDIRFVEIDGEWWAILKDICNALKLRTDKIASRLDPSMLERVLVEALDPRSFEGTLDTSKDDSTSFRSNHLLRVDRHEPIKRIDRATIGKDIGRKPGENKTRWMLAVNELGIYEALFASRKLEARKFRMWAGTVMKKLRTHVGLEGYEVMRMTEPEIQSEIDDILDTLFWDDEKKMLMRSVTVQGGDVDQIPFE